MNQESPIISVRDASFDDAEFIAEANFAMAKEIENIELDRDILFKGVRAVFRDPSRGRYIIGEYNGKVAGCLLITHEWSDWRNCNIAWIQSLYVEEEYRGQGVFKHMFASIEKLVEKGEYAGIRLYVEKSNDNAMEVYSGLGMRGDHYLLFEKMK